MELIDDIKGGNNLGNVSIAKDLMIKIFPAVIRSNRKHSPNGEFDKQLPIRITQTPLAIYIKVRGVSPADWIHINIEQADVLKQHRAISFKRNQSIRAGDTRFRCC